MIDLDVVRADLRALGFDPATDADVWQAVARWRGLVGAPRENVTDRLHAAADAARERGRLKDEADAARLVAEEEARLAETEAEAAAARPPTKPVARPAKRKGR